MPSVWDKNSLSPAPNPPFALGFLDSGVGGLSVYKVFKKAFPHLPFLYLGDTAHMPYGNKSGEHIYKLIERNLQLFLLKGVSKIILACHTASSIMYEKASPFENIHIHGMIAPSVLKALSHTQNGSIGLIGTKTTIESGVYRKIFSQHKDIHLIEQACPSLASLIEEGMMDHPALYLLLKTYLQPFQKSGCDTLILGCTHYPVIAPLIQKILPHTHLVDAAGELLALEHTYLNSLFYKEKKPAKDVFYVTEKPEAFQRTAFHFVGALNSTPQEFLPEQQSTPTLMRAESANFD